MGGMTGQEVCQRIVQTKAGQRTGETLYLTESGQWWTSEVGPCNSYTTVHTGNEIGYVHGDHMCSHP